MFLRSVLIVIGAACGASAHGTLLKANGLLRTVRMDRASVQLTLFPEFSDAYTVHQSGGRFEVELPYHAHYLLRAEAPGCATKEVIFDTNLPLLMDGLERSFPLEILMEMMAADAPYQYAGPVGLVYFDEALQDFVYTTDHRRIYDRSIVVTTMHHKAGIPDEGAWAAGAKGFTPLGDPLAARLPQLELGRTPQLSTAGTARIPSGARVVGEQHQGLLEPNAVEHHTPAKDQATAIATRSVEGAAKEIGSLMGPGTALVAGAEVEKTAVLQEQGSWSIPGSASAECGAQERVRLAHCLITIDHLNVGTGCAELRKAEHNYGAVFYFHDGRSITEQHYRKLLRERTH